MTRSRRTLWHNRIMIWDLTNLQPAERKIIEDAIARTNFNWQKLEPKLRATKNKSQIPVEFIDLSRYAAQLEKQTAAGGHNHIHEGDDKADPVMVRERVLGLAWYSGKVSIAHDLVNNPALAQEIFLAEGAHMVDFFYMTDANRKAIYEAYHAGDTTEHGHDWFDKGTYWEWVGESFMGGFTAAFSDLPNTNNNFIHKETPAVIAVIRRELGDTQYFGKPGSQVYHKQTHRIKNLVPISPEGRRPCKVCKPAAA